MSHSLVIKMLKIVFYMGESTAASFIHIKFPEVCTYNDTSPPTRNIEDESYAHQICFKLMLADHSSISLYSQIGNSLQICFIPKHPSKHPTWALYQAPTQAFKFAPYMLAPIYPIPY